MKQYLISPHDDDHTLFCAYICMRQKPTVVIVLDSYIQPNRGEKGCSAEERAEETRKSCEILGCEVIRLGLRDDMVSTPQIRQALFDTIKDADVIYAPMLQGGNIHHDMIHKACKDVFTNRVIYYPTYTKTELYTEGKMRIDPTVEELNTKIHSLQVYESQIRINAPHFQAVLGKPEWLTRGPLKKVFLITELGSPFYYTQEFINQCGKLEEYGWYWKIFTPNKYENVPSNVEIVDMNCEQLADLMEQKLQVRPKLFITEFGNPSMHVTDFYIYSGILFEDYIKDADFWGITNLDVVYGRLDHFISDDYLNDCDIFSDDLNAINGVFCLWRNIPEVNNLFKKITNWQDPLKAEPCTQCTLRDGKGHQLAGTDEYWMSHLLKQPMASHIRYKYPKYQPMHGHDRLEQHVPEIKLKWEDDGSLWELFADINGPKWEHARPFIGREIPYFHFPKSKKWPNIK